MLVNKTKEIVDVKYNQITLSVEPGGQLDVRDFGIPTTSIQAVEKHIVLKNPNKFDVEETKDILATNKEYLAKIAEQDKEIARLTKELDSRNAALSKIQDKVDHFNSEKEGLLNQIKSLKNEVGELKGKVKKLS